MLIVPQIGRMSSGLTTLPRVFRPRHCVLVTYRCPSLSGIISQSGIIVTQGWQIVNPCLAGSKKKGQRFHWPYIHTLVFIYLMRKVHLLPHFGHLCLRPFFATNVLAFLRRLHSLQRNGTTSLGAVLAFNGVASVLNNGCSITD